MKIPLHKILFSVVILVMITGTTEAQKNDERGRIKISANGHFLQYEDGTPFFWLGDTAWELFHRLSREDIEAYLTNRQQKGFNVIQAVALAEFGGLTVPNHYGELPFKDMNPEKPNEKYFELIDWTIQQAQKRNMFIGLLPTWGDKVSKFWGWGPEVFNEKNAYSYGLFLGKRYKDYGNIIWIAGGDRPARDSADWRPVWRGMIKGIREGTENKALITYHPGGESSSSRFWKDEQTLDINMMQSGHGRHDVPVWGWIVSDFNLQPSKPVLDGEPNYEDHAIAWKLENGYFRDYDVRKQLYRSVFSGACGVTYGHHAIWQFYTPDRDKITFVDRTWQEALDRPGAWQAGYLKKLILSRPHLDRLTAQDIILEGQGEGGEYITAFRDKTASYAMLYMPVAKNIKVNLNTIKSNKIIAWWFNPVNGKASKAGVYKNTGAQWFTPPLTTGKDIVLVLDDASVKRRRPGA